MGVYSPEQVSSSAFQTFESQNRKIYQINIWELPGACENYIDYMVLHHLCSDFFLMVRVESFTRSNPADCLTVTTITAAFTAFPLFCTSTTPTSAAIASHLSLPNIYVNLQTVLCVKRLVPLNCLFEVSLIRSYLPVGSADLTLPPESSQNDEFCKISVEISVNKKRVQATEALKGDKITSWNEEFILYASLLVANQPIEFKQTVTGPGPTRQPFLCVSYKTRLGLTPSVYA
jgi:hypothetical protein